MKQEVLEVEVAPGVEPAGDHVDHRHRQRRLARLAGAEPVAPEAGSGGRKAPRPAPPPPRGPRRARRRAPRWPPAAHLFGVPSSAISAASSAGWSSSVHPDDRRRRSRSATFATAREHALAAVPVRVAVAELERLVPARARPGRARSPGPTPPSSVVASTSTVGRPARVEHLAGGELHQVRHAGVPSRRRGDRRIDRRECLSSPKSLRHFPCQDRRCRVDGRRRISRRDGPGDGGGVLAGRRGNRPGCCRRPGPAYRPPRAGSSGGEVGVTRRRPRQWYAVARTARSGRGTCPRRRPCRNALSSEVAQEEPEVVTPGRPHARSRSRRRSALGDGPGCSSG